MLALLLLAAAPDARPPNVLLILADDLGYGDVGCYNEAAKVATPRIDALAATGVRFTDAHSPCTVCTPTRYGLLTGQMPFRVPNGGRVFSGAGGPSLIADERLTLPEMLRDAGYATACIGKWHLGLTFRDADGEAIHASGPDAAGRIDFTRRIEGGPLDHGFDTFFGTACCPTTDWLYCFIEGDRVPTPPARPLDKSRLPKHPYANDCRPGRVAPDFDMERVDLQFLERSQAWLRRHAAESPGRPFFLFHSTQAVHLPSFPAAEFQGATTAGPHGDFIAELDFVVGSLLDTLDGLSLRDDTLVIFTSDNGPEVPTAHYMRRDHGHDGAAPWRGLKRDNWEGGHRVPFLAAWPRAIEGGSVRDDLVSLTDVTATLADVLGVDLPGDAAEDGFSLLPTLRGEGPVGRPYVLFQGFRGGQSLGLRQGQWKYLNHGGSGGNDYATHPLLSEYRLDEPTAEAAEQLYDLAADPGETRNLAAERPEVTRRLRELLAASVRSGRTE